MADFGYYVLLLALISATYTAAAAVVGHHRKSARLATSSEYGVFVVFGLLSIASSALIYLFVADDYSVKYVQHYSDRSMPLFYKVTSFWGGQDGSLLFWVWVMSIWAAIAVYQNRNKNKEILPYTIVSMMIVTLFFVVMLVFATNPFETYLAGAPSDGRGLNPMLQNPYMVTHPPTLYLGYIGWTIPFCFAMGALVHGKLDYSWIAAMRRWCLVAWVFLTVGLTLGGLWAYEELGWGGYWAWDPVENAAFIPWLTGTAFIHSVQVQERRQMYKLWNLFLIIITFILTLVGTMMTRSGVVQSVHAFAQSDIGTIFFVFIIFWLVVGCGMLLYRARELQAQSGLESIVSREFVLLINNWVLLVAAFLVLFGTLFPSIWRGITGEEINVGASFFNKWMIPVGILMLGLTGIGPLLSWRKSTGKTIRDQFTVPFIIGLVGAAVIHYGAQVTHVAALITLSLCVFVTATIIQEFWRGTRYRMKNANQSFVPALMTLVGRAKRRYGGYTIHFGMVLMFVGFAGNAINLAEEKQLAQGESTTIGSYQVTLTGLIFEDDGQKNMVTAEVAVADSSGKPLGVLRPAKWFYRKPEETTTTEVDKLMSLKDDLYLVLGNFDGQAKTAALQLKVNPLVNFVWLGCTFMLLGFSIAIWPDRRRGPELTFRRGWGWTAASSAAALLGLFSAIMAFV